ncbi:hypothetical protein [Streptomyces tropicalis]|uniref:Uncharacterized protein n=1 Tax=Streptomyces tropicalis TaxID=3034234 RepID=A0ABT6A452_9ACTN|nr:hypothetical protein [Streptomyces tropicalis]MDF3299253.1 hypothetical protein [Streptomyces tropicalis]
MIALALLVPVALMLMLFAMDALETRLLRRPDPPPSDVVIPDQSVPD